MKIFNYQLSIVNLKIIIPLLMLFLIVLGCQLSVEKPSRDGTGNMAIKIVREGLITSSWYARSFWQPFDEEKREEWENAV